MPDDEPWKQEPWYKEHRVRWEKLIQEGWEFADNNTFGSRGIRMRRAWQSAEFSVSIGAWAARNWRERVNLILLRRCEAFAEIFRQEDKDL